METSIMGVMKMGNIVHRAGIEPTSLAFRASVLPLHHVGYPDVTTIPTPTCLCGPLPQRSVHATTVGIIHVFNLSHEMCPKYA